MITLRYMGAKGGWNGGGWVAETGPGKLDHDKFSR